MAISDALTIPGMMLATLILIAWLSHLAFIPIARKSPRWLRRLGRTLWFGVLGLFIGSSVGRILAGIFDPSLNGTGLPELLPVGWNAQMSIIFATGLAAALYGLFHLPALPAASVAAYRTAVAEHGSHPSFGKDILEEMRTSPMYSYLPYNIWHIHHNI